MKLLMFLKCFCFDEAFDVFEMLLMKLLINHKYWDYVFCLN